MAKPRNRTYGGNPPASEAPPMFSPPTGSPAAEAAKRLSMMVASLDPSAAELKCANEWLRHWLGQGNQPATPLAPDLERAARRTFAVTVRNRGLNYRQLPGGTTSWYAAEVAAIENGTFLALRRS